MLWRKAARIALTAAATFQQTTAKLITVTEFPTSCKAIYTSGSRSVTIVRTSISVVPTPWTESDANNGEPFVLEVESPSGQNKRQVGERRMVRPNGTITTSQEDAAQFVIDGKGRLTSVDGGYISTDGTQRHELFAFSSTDGSVDTEFSIEHGVLTWANDAFTDGAAQFYQVGVGVNGNKNRVLVRFNGRINPNWEAISLVARPPSEGSESASATIMLSSAQHTRATNGGATGGGNTRHTRSRTRDHNQPSAAGTQSASTSPLASGSVSPDGSCGGDTGYTCIGSGFGDCCSRRGECGSGKRFCNNGCQSLYGICMSGSSSAMSSMTSISWPATISVSVPSISIVTTVSGSSSVPIPSSTFTSTAGPIGPIDNSIFPSRASSVGAASGQSPPSSAAVSASSTTPSQPPVAVCPTSTADLCGFPDNSATCSSPGGTPYNNTCGVIYRGPVIDTSGIRGLPPQRGVAYQGTEIDTANVVGLRKRATEDSLADCQTLCDRYTTCVVFNYIGTNCTLLSGITGTDYLAGAVGGAVPQEYIPAKTNPPTTSAPTSPGESSAAAVGSSPAEAPSSAGPGMGMQSSQAPVVVSSAGPGQAMSSSNPAIVMSSSSPPQMAMSTISEVLTSSTAGATPVVTSNPTGEATSSALTSTAEQELPSSNPLSVVIPPTAASSTSSSTPTSNPACPAANDTHTFDSAGNEYVVLCDVDIDGAELTTSQEETFEACIETCAETSDCVGVSFVQTDSGDDSLICTTYTEYGGTSPQLGASAAVLVSVLGTIAPPSNPSSSAALPETSNAASSTISGPEPASSSIAPSSSPAVTSAPAPSFSATSSSSSTSSTPTRTYYLVLDSPTPCDFGDYADDGTPLDEDDNFCEIDLPFAMRMYSEHDTFTYASTNGYLSLSSGSSQYGNQPFPASNLPANVVAPFFDDLYIVGNSSPQSGIFYEIDGGAVTYEYYLNRGANSGAAVDPSVVYHFTVHYDSAQPGIFTYTYYEMGDAGQYAAVGMQGIGPAGTEIGFTYSYMSPSITSGLVVRCNTLTNTCITVSR